MLTQEERIEQACRVYGEKWRNILHKKWSFFHNICPEDSLVYLVTEVHPNIGPIYDTEEAATNALRKILKERLEKSLNREYWTQTKRRWR